jgi:predicted dehydrogenase
MFRWLFGDVAKARAAARTAIASRPDASGEMHPCTAEDGFSATLVSLSGVSATLDSSFASPVNLESRITVFGSDGVLEQRGERSVSLLRTDAEPEEHTFDVSDPAQAFRRWAAVVRQAVVDGGAEAGAATFADGLAAARVLEALRAGGDPLGAS